VRAPASALAQGMSSLSPGPLIGRRRWCAGRRYARRRFFRGWFGRPRRVPITRGSASCKYIGRTRPAPSSPARGHSLGLICHRTAQRFPAAVIREDPLRLGSCHSRGYMPLLPEERRRGASAHARATRVPAGDERSGPGPTYVFARSRSLHYWDSSQLPRSTTEKTSSRVSAARALATKHHQRARRKRAHPPQGHTSLDPPITLPFQSASKSGMSPSKPSALPRQPIGLDAVVGAELADRFG